MLTEIEMDTKVCSQCKSVKLLSEFSRQKSSKEGHQYKCKACAKEYNAKCYAANSEKIKEYSAEYRVANPEKCKEYSAEYRAANTEKTKERNAEYRTANSEKEKEYRAEYYAANSEKEKEYSAEYQKANLHKFRTYGSNRRAAKLEAIPAWLTEKDWQSMDDINEEADRLTKETGIKHEVDHIHPLQGKLICGLQCPTNLQILTKSQNCSKGNRFTPYVESELTD